MPREVIHAKVGIQNVFKVVGLVSFLVLVGAGCAIQSKDVGRTTTTTEQTRITPPTKPGQNQRIAMLFRACLKRGDSHDPKKNDDREWEKAQEHWEGSEIFNFFVEQAGVKFTPDFNVAIQKKLDEGWRFSIVCNEPSERRWPQTIRPTFFFAMYLLEGDWIPWFQKEQKGMPNLIGEYQQGLDPQFLPAYLGRSFSTLRDRGYTQYIFSDPIGIPAGRGFQESGAGIIINLLQAYDGTIFGDTMRNLDFSDRLQFDPEHSPRLILKQTRKLP